VGYRNEERSTDLRLQESSAGVVAVANAPDGERVLSAGPGNAVHMWELETKQYLGSIASHDEALICLAVGSGGRLLVTGSRDRSARIWTLFQGASQAPAISQKQWIGAVAISPDDEIVATGVLDTEMVRLWRVRSGLCEAEFGPAEGVYDLVFSPDGQTLLAGTMTGALWCDRSSGRSWPLVHDAPVFAVAFHPLGHTFVTGCGDGALQWWNSQTRQCDAVVNAHTDRLKKACYSPTGDLIATVGWDSKLRFWHDRTHRQIGPAVPLSDGGQSVTFGKDGEIALVGCKNGRIEVVSVPRRTSASPRRIVLWLQLMTGIELDDSDLIRSLDTTAWYSRWRELDSSGGMPWG